LSLKFNIVLLEFITYFNDHLVQQTYVKGNLEGIKVIFKSHIYWLYIFRTGFIVFSK